MPATPTPASMPRSPATPPPAPADTTVGLVRLSDEDSALGQLAIYHAVPATRDVAVWESITAEGRTGHLESVLLNMQRINRSAIAKRKADAAEYRSQCWDTEPPRHTQWYRYQAEHLDWMRRAHNFNRLVGTALHEVRAVVSAREVSWRARYESLARSVARHRESVLESAAAPADHDSALWECIDGCG